MSNRATTAPSGNVSAHTGSHRLFTPLPTALRLLRQFTAPAHSSGQEHCGPCASPSAPIVANPPSCQIPTLWRPCALRRGEQRPARLRRRHQAGVASTQIGRCPAQQQGGALPLHMVSDAGALKTPGSCCAARSARASCHMLSHAVHAAWLNIPPTPTTTLLSRGHSHQGRRHARGRRVQPPAVGAATPSMPSSQREAPAVASAASPELGDAELLLSHHAAKLASRAALCCHISQPQVELCALPHV